MRQEHPLVGCQRQPGWRPRPTAIIITAVVSSDRHQFLTLSTKRRACSSILVASSGVLKSFSVSA